MKKKFAILTALAFITASAFADTKLVDGKYNIDASHTKVGFGVEHLVISVVEGTFKDIKGTFNLNNDLSKSLIDVSIPVSSIDTDNSQRDEHLRNSDFFDAKKYPNIIFKSKKFTGDLKKFKVIGDLTIKNVTKEVTLKGKYTGSVKDPWGNQRAALKASGKIKRADFGLTYNSVVEAGPAIGEEVTLDLSSEGILEVAKK